MVTLAVMEGLAIGVDGADEVTMYSLQSYVVAYNTNDQPTPAMLHDVVSPDLDAMTHDFDVICQGYQITKHLTDPEIEAYTRGEYR